MSLALAVAAGTFCAVGVYLLMQRSITRIVLGVGALGNGVNLVVLMSGGTGGTAPIVGRPGPFNDPYPQAFILTAIVIGLAITSFMVALAWRSWTIDGNDNVEDDIEDRRLAAEPQEEAAVRMRAPRGRSGPDADATGMPESEAS
jgi:multicomponent Na+:H+ antiporter subunit C